MYIFTEETEKKGSWKRKLRVVNRVSLMFSYGLYHTRDHHDNSVRQCLYPLSTNPETDTEKD